jgi:hypothetical protein
MFKGHRHLSVSLLVKEKVSSASNKLESSLTANNFNPVRIGYLQTFLNCNRKNFYDMFDTGISVIIIVGLFRPASRSAIWCQCYKLFSR